MYFYQGLSTALGNFGNSLAGRRHVRKTYEYLKEPIRITGLTDEEKLQKRIRFMEEQSRKIHEAVAVVQQHERMSKKKRLQERIDQQNARKKPKNEQK